MVTVSEIREKYPNPKNMDRTVPGECNYCIGGGLSLYLYYNDKPYQAYIPSYFPTESKLALDLKFVNPLLDDEIAEYYAEQITKYNDRGEFEDAWAWMELAFNYEGTP